MQWLAEELQRLEQAGLRRRLPEPLVCQGPLVEQGGRRLVNFASNDYLGLASDPRLAHAASEACRIGGVGRGASPLVCGRSPVHRQLEQRLALLEGTESALLFPSGFAANSGVVPTLVDEPDAVYADAKNHASLIDGCRLTRAARWVYPHNDCETLARMLSEGASYRRRLIVTDALFSMDGDLAPIPRLAALARRFDAMLLVDEAHALGVLGRNGGGGVEYFDDTAEAGAPSLKNDERLIRVGTLSKALGAAGGFVCGSHDLIDWIANRARSYVFSTAAPTALAAAAETALDIAAHEPHRRERLLENARFLRELLRAQGRRLGNANWHILPVYVGEPQQAVALSSALRLQGFWAPAIRPPSVPDGESLLRLSLRADHTPDMLQGFAAALAAT